MDLKKLSVSTTIQMIQDSIKQQAPVKFQVP